MIKLILRNFLKEKKFLPQHLPQQKYFNFLLSIIIYKSKIKNKKIKIKFSILKFKKQIKILNYKQIFKNKKIFF